MKYHLISALLLIAAAVLETLGLAGSFVLVGAGVLLGAGVGCEVWFWMRMVRGRRSSQAPRAA